MKQMKTLTVNGVTYAVTDPTAPRVDDSAVGDAPWSAKKIVDTLAPAFAQTGDTVVCRPVAGYPLAVTAQISSVQAGTGTPSSDNIRPITGRDGVELTVTNGAHTATVTAALGQTVYGGTYDISTGLLTLTHSLLELTADMDWSMTAKPNDHGFRSFYTQLYLSDTRTSPQRKVVCSHYPSTTGWSNSSINQKSVKDHYTGGVALLYIADNSFETLAEFKAFLQANAVQLVYQLQDPVTVQLEPQQIPALSGTNTLTADTGSITVTGRADPAALLEVLAAAAV